MAVEQLNIFEELNESYKITKPIRLIEFFAGIGAQSKALEILGVPFESYKTCEWSKESIKAYKQIHNYDKHIEVNLTKEELIEKVRGISSNYNEPMSDEQLNKLSLEELKFIHECNLINHNLINISDVKGSDLEIVDTNKYEYLLTYSFPCLTNDSLILTKRGYIPMEEVTLDDYVLTKSNTWQKVSKKFDNGIHQTYYLKGMGFENIHCTENHKFWVRTMYRKGKKQIRCFTEPEFKEVKDITRKDYFGMPVIKEEIPFYTNDLDFWYMLGMYTGDGWYNKNQIRISCNEKKLEKLKKALDVNKWKYTIYKNTTCYVLVFSNKEIKDFIAKYIGKGCLNKHIAYEILCLPKEQLQAFYNGYLDSDGCVVQGKHQFSSISRNLIYSVSCIINKLYHRPTSISLNIVKPKKVIEGRIVNQHNWYLLRFNPKTNKQDKAFYENGYIWYPFTRLEKAEKEHVYNMEIENDHSYIVQGCISKNCQDLSLAGKRLGMEEDSQTRSSLLWQVGRILEECEEKPQILLMENVQEIVSVGNRDNFYKWIGRLNELGYSSFWKILNSKDYGVPQNRTRCFMVSILDKNTQYKFPQKMKLDYKLKDFFDKKVNKKYYLSETKLEKISQWKAQQDPLKGIEKEKLICPTLTARGAGEEHSGMILINEEPSIIDDRDKTYKGIKENSICPTQRASRNGLKVLFPNSHIRKLTPCESYKLMGFTELDYKHCAEIQSDTKIYHQAGDSIVTTCIIGLLGTMLDIDYKKVIKNYVKEIINGNKEM